MTVGSIRLVRLRRVRRVHFQLEVRSITSEDGGQLVNTVHDGVAALVNVFV